MHVNNPNIDYNNNKDGSFYCVAFVAPVKKKSIPRLELLGCLALSGSTILVKRYETLQMSTKQGTHALTVLFFVTHTRCAVDFYIPHLAAILR